MSALAEVFAIPIGGSGEEAREGQQEVERKPHKQPSKFEDVGTLLCSFPPVEFQRMFFLAWVEDVRGAPDSSFSYPLHMPVLYFAQVEKEVCNNNQKGIQEVSSPLCNSPPLNGIERQLLLHET